MSRFILGAAGGLALTATGAVQQPRAIPQRPIRPVVIAAGRHDTSPLLRELPPVPPAARHEPEEREKRLTRPIRRDRSLPDPVVQTSPGATAMPAATRSIEGIGNVNGVLPPDTNAAVGPNHYVQSVNVSFAIYSKGSTGQPPVLLYGPAQTSTLWTGFGGPCEARNDGDAIVMYDQLADRWVVSQLALPNLFFGIAIAPFYQCLAISATPDPAGAYHRYQFAFNKLNDYPKLGVWPDAYYMAINQFSAVTLQYAGQGVIAFDRQKMLAGLPATMQYVDLAAVDMNLAGMLPASLDGPPPPAGSPGYFVQMDDDAWGYSGDRLQLWRFHVNWTTPSASSFTGPSLLPVAPFDTNLCNYARSCIPQPGTSAAVDAMADRLMYRLQYRNFGTHESLVVNHTVDADGADHAGIRWYEIRDPRTSPVVHQQGTYAPDADHRWMGSAAMDGAGNLALGFSIASGETWPSIRYTGRLAGDPPGAMTQGEAELVAGTGSQTHESGRWGDYSMMAVDPADQCTFWYTQEYYAATSGSGWRTRIGTFSFPSCDTTGALPRATITATAGSASEAGPVNGVLSVTRTGDVTAALTVFYAVSGTASPGVDYATLSGVVTIPAGSSSAPVVITPVDDPYSEPDETVAVTIGEGAGYVAGSPSQAVATIVSDDQPPDLIVSALTGPSAAAPGGTMVTSDTTKNQGAGAADVSTTAFYLSANVLFDATDVFLGSRPVPALAPGGSSSGTVSLPVPASTATGTYYILARADGTAGIAETSEANNTRFSGAIRVGPDLVIPSLTGPGIGGSGDLLTITDTTRNQGSTTAGASTTSFYFSTNAVFDGTDPAVGSRAVGTLAAGTGSAASTAVRLPAGLATGTYYLFARADTGGAVVESSETNNVSAGLAVRVGPDLTVASLTAPASVAAGAFMTIGDSIANTGAGAAGDSTVRYYLSVNLALDASDVLLGSRAVPALAGGASSAGATSAGVPGTVAAGSYWLIGVADATGAIAETSETNNTRLVFIRVTAGS